ncbi:4Fe-4S dicluster domain-containing protein [Lebetimonas sp. JH292]|uniref:4Fe-4S dicluster domain-containing protein n=1 Tax=Lebetimonas sp. JH292 TaxID=990068 RepID=UPI000466654B|nr:4Fe-4S dicluster domain-containing protein [Lebetimonas sp. JH292]
MQSTRKNKFVIANPEVCIGCATCMAACYKSAYERGKLATPRLIVTRTFNGVMPNQCRQCDDAPCANVCPVGALTFGEDCIELHEEICIGCKLCTIACPFGAIRPAAETMPSVDYALEPDAMLTLESVAGLKTVAVKCDLCKGREGGPACVEACPTGALMFLEPNKQENMILEKSEKAVEKTVETSHQHKG